MSAWREYGVGKLQAWEGRVVKGADPLTPQCLVYANLRTLPATMQSVQSSVALITFLNK